MPTGMTFNSLQTDVHNYVERGFTEASDPIVYAQIPSLINFAERRIARELKLQGILTPLTFSLTDGTAVYDKPDRWLSTVSLNIGTGTTHENRKTLYPRAYEYLLAYWPDRTATAEPDFYADYDYSHFLLAATPDADYPAELNAYLQPEFLQDSQQTNFFTDYTPDLLLYAALVETSPFLKSDEYTQRWQGYYQDAKGSYNTQDLQKILDRSAAAPRTRP